MDSQNNTDAFGASLAELLREMLAVRDEVIKNAHQRLTRYSAYFSQDNYSKSAWNLAHYLALRHQDQRPLQKRLAQAGLSSLGRGEAHILTNIDRVIELLRRAIGAPAQPLPDIDFREGPQLLKQHADKILGLPPQERYVRIMVTLPSEAAHDDALIPALMTQGMDCARINCAHDGPEAWEQMVARIRRASEEQGRPCKILMDLAGHKLRTGPLASAPAVRHLGVKRNAYGSIIQPTEVLLAPENITPLPENALPLPAKLAEGLVPGDRLNFADSRGKKRNLDIIERRDDGLWLAHCHQNTYLAAETTIYWQRPDDKGRFHTLHTDTLPPFSGPPLDIRLFRGDQLLLTRHPEPGQAAQYDGSGQLIAPTQISCSHPEILDRLAPGDPVWIDDGKLGTEVITVNGNGALLRVTQAGPKGVRLHADKGLNFPETPLNLPSLSAEDLNNLDFVCHHADMVGFSFVESVEDMECLMKALQEYDRPDLPIIAKIETQRAVKNLPDIILGTIGRHTLGIMIARGDLAVELGSVRLAEIQEEILWLCEAAHVPVIWATQVLETLAKKGLTSRPEITDAAMGVRAECVMLNKGPYVTEAVRVLGNILTRMQAHQRKKTPRLRALHW